MINKVPEHIENLRAEHEILLFESTVVTYRLGEQHLRTLEKATAFDTVNRFAKTERMKLVEAECMTDVFAYPAFVVFIDFANVDDAERKMLLSCLYEIEDPQMQKEFEQLAKEEGWNLNKNDFPDTLYFVLNAQPRPDEYAPLCFRAAAPLFEQPDRMRLSLLRHAQSLQTKKKMRENPERLYRVLAMYKHLRDYGYISEPTFAERSGETARSRETFFRDLQVLRTFTGDAIPYHHKEKKYILESDHI